MQEIHHDSIDLEPKHRDSWFESRLDTGFCIKILKEKSRNRSWNQNYDSKSGKQNWNQNVVKAEFFLEYKKIPC